MKQSSLLEFECSDFAVTPDEDKETNPGGLREEPA
jgi:hypothetical protein